MAHSLRRPIFQTRGLFHPNRAPSPCLSISSSLYQSKPTCQHRSSLYEPKVLRRTFTQIFPRWAGPGPQQPQAVRSRQRAEKSLHVLQKEQMAKGVIPSDVGILDQTFVRPPINWFSLFKEPRRFSKFQYARSRAYLRDLLSLLVVKISSPQAGKRWYTKSYKISRSSIRPIAQRLHVDMYTAFAAGDLQSLQAICTEGIYESFRARINARQKGETVKWELLRYIGTPKVVSDRGAMVPGVEGMAIRQAVLRVRSLQRLTREVGNKKVQGTGEGKEIEEYVVVQQILDRWKAGEWKVWGTTQATRLEDVEEWEKRAV